MTAGAFRRRGRSSRLGTAALFILLAMDLTAQVESGPGVDTDAEARWLDGAAAALDSGDSEGALAAAKSVLATDGTNSDFLFLEARAALASDGLVRPALGDVKSALLADRFARFSRNDALIFEAQLLTRLRRWDEALSALQAVSDRVSAPAALERIRALIGLGNWNQALVEFEGARSAWPSDRRFATLFFSSWKPAPTERSRRLAAAYLVLAGDPSFPDVELARLSLPFLPSQGDRKHLLESLRAAKGAVASIEACQFGLIGFRKAVDEIFAGKAPLQRSDLESLASLADPDGLSYLETRLAAFSGTVVSDSDKDGIFDSTAVYKDGQLAEWKTDSDQDGFFETDIAFAYGIPSGGSWSANAALFSYSWAAWPWLASASRDSLDASVESVLPSPAHRSWKLADSALSWRPLSMLPFPSAASTFFLVDPTDAPAPLERSLTASAILMDIHRPDGDLEVDMRKGLPIQARLMDKDRLVARFEYDRGHPLMEYLDQDGDGRFETRITLDPQSDPADPVALSFESDIDGDGVYEYREELLPPFRKTWDLEPSLDPRTGN